MQTQITSEAHRYFYESLSEVADYIRDTPRKWTYNESHDGPVKQSWDLATGYSKALTLMDTGWSDGAKKAQAILKTFKPASFKPDTRNDFYGFRPNVPRYCAGAPDCMVRRDKRADQGAGAALTLVVPLSANCGTSAEHMMNFGCAIAQTVAQMEHEGTRCEVFGAISVRLRAAGCKVHHVFRIKRADAPLNLPKLAFAIGHPAMLRRIGFALIERTDREIQAPGYGAALGATLQDVINVPASAVIINGMDDADRVAKTPESALAHIQAAIAKGRQELRA